MKTGEVINVFKTMYDELSSGEVIERYFQGTFNDDIVRTAIATILTIQILMKEEKENESI